MAAFKVDHRFELKSSGMFVLAGAIVEGVVCCGMKIWLGEGHAEPIAQLEFIRYADRRPEAETAVCLHYSTDEQLASLQSLDLIGRILTID